MKGLTEWCLVVGERNRKELEKDKQREREKLRGNQRRKDRE